MARSLVFRDLFNIKNTFFGCLTVGKGAFKFVRAVFFAHVIIILMIFGIGTALILVRAFVFWAAPHLKRGAKVVAGIVDILQELYNFFYDAFAIGYNVISRIVYTGEQAKCTLTSQASRNCPLDGDPPSIKLRNPLTTKYVSPTQVRQALDRVTVACERYDSVSTMLTLALAEYLGPTVCPMVRYLYPVPFLYDGARSIAWFSPDPTPIGYAGENNCKVTTEDQFDYVCTGMGLGYIVTEFLLPLFIGILLLSAMALPLMHLVSVLARLTYTTILSTYELTHYAVKAFDTSLLWFIDEALEYKERRATKKRPHRPLS